MYGALLLWSLWLDLDFMSCLWMTSPNIHGCFHSWINLILLLCFKVLKFMLKIYCLAKFQTLRTDGGGEYVSSSFQNFLKQHGIGHQLSCPHTPEQNGCAEQKHRHVVKIGLSFLFHAGIPPNTGLMLFWLLPISLIGWLCALWTLLHPGKCC